jgi:hypothetical protein
MPGRCDGTVTVTVEFLGVWRRLQSGIWSRLAGADWRRIRKALR